MDSQNIKVYLAISGALIVLFILIILVPFSSKKPTTQDKTTNPNGQLFPTSVETNSLPNNQATNNPSPITTKAGFTGAIEEQIPQPIIDLSNQKRDLQSKTPLDLTAFSIDFDYSEDKFSITLKDPKDQARREFESWRSTNYPGLNTSQFNFK